MGRKSHTVKRSNCSCAYGTTSYLLGIGALQRIARTVQTPQGTTGVPQELVNGSTGESNLLLSDTLSFFPVVTGGRRKIPDKLRKERTRRWNEWQEELEQCERDWSGWKIAGRPFCKLNANNKYEKWIRDNGLDGSTDRYFR